MEKNRFESLFAINVNAHKEEKNGLSYLSWAWAWSEFCKIYPDATYSVYKNEQGLPYVYDENTGYMVYVSVQADGLTHEMWLPVMDSNNRAMKSKPYTIKTKYKEITVQAATMFDINKTLMRCLVKALGMFGLGLYIYSGEDLPEEAQAEKLVSRQEKEELLLVSLNNTGKSALDMYKFFGVGDMTEMTEEQIETALGWFK